MKTFSKESLELLRARANLVEVLSPHLQLKRAGAVYKALCPFHEEKSPSFIVKTGDTHYHCFGCGAHGDAIQFLMAHLRLDFRDAVESLAERFGVQLEQDEGEVRGPSKAALKEVLTQISAFFHFFLLHTEEGHSALDYLYGRGLDLNFIRTFQLGLAPRDSSLFLNVMKEQGVTEELLRDAGLFAQSGRVLFYDRITLPIRDSLGSVIGFSARKFRPEATTGPKYVNTPETVLFKKSRVLFGLNYSKKRIIKEHRALIVEGQIDALRLISAGFDWTVAGQGTAFGVEHVQELIQLEIREAWLALDGDTAGQEAIVKIGHLFQKEGIEVFVVPLPNSQDPDQILREEGPAAWNALLDRKSDYLSFLVQHLSRAINTETPAGKNQLVEQVSERIRDWNHPVMVHESLRKLAQLTHTPEKLLNIPDAPPRPTYLSRPKVAEETLAIDADRVLEADLLRWLLLIGEGNPSLLPLAKMHLTAAHFYTPVGRELFTSYLNNPEQRDLLSLAMEPEQQRFVAEILEKRVNRERAVAGFTEALQRMLDRHWLREREKIQREMASGKYSEEELLGLAKQFGAMTRPQISVV